MSTTIDERVVGMRFDNKQFESNVATTMSTIEKLKQSLNLTGATKGLENIDSAARKVNMSGLGSAVETVGMKFNALWTIADQTLRDITHSVNSTAKRMISALTIDPIKTGLSEYETQINAVQTIMANTQSKGTTLDQVNSALDELNTYADKTIYNFTEMTRNIGTFTAAGVDLDTSVKSIQGIANLAAVSGSSSQQASTAMYQLSQALAAGKVSLMDWNSVVNAGMGGQVFQDALKRTAEVMTGKDMDAVIKKYGSFRESLTEGEWLTTDVLTKTLEQFTMSAKEGSKEWDAFKKSLMDDGYTEAQAVEILKMANTATDAATKVKTFTQLWDTLKETAQSGWTQTWELILGDFEDAKTLFSELYQMLSPIIEKSAEARNELLQGWVKWGGRDDLISSFKNVFTGLSSIIAPIKEAFREFFPPITVKQLYNFTKGLYVLTSKLKIGSETADKLKRAFSGVFAAADIVRDIFVSVFKAMSPLFGGIGNLGGGILDFAANLGDSVVSFNEFLESSGTFEKVTEKIRGGLEQVGEFLTKVKSGIDSVVDAISTRLSGVSTKIEGRFEPLKALGEFIMAVFKGIGDVVYKVAPYVMNIAQGIGNVLSDLMGRISSAVKDADYSKLFDAVNGGIFASIGVFIANFIKSGGDILDGAGGFLENINGILEGVSDAFGAFTDSMKAETLKKIAIAIGILAASLLVLSLIDSDKLTTSLLAISTLFAELMGSMAIFAKILDGKKLKGLGKMALALIGLSTSLLILSAALKIMSTMSWSEMGVGLTAMTVGLAALVGAVNLLPKDTSLRAAGMIGLATSMILLGAALKIMATMSWGDIGRGLSAMAGGLIAMVGAVNLLPKDAALRSAGMIGLATAMVVLGAALKIMATMSWDEINRGLSALAGSLLFLTASMNLMKSALPGAAAMMIVAPAIVVLAGALQIFSTMSWDEIGRGLASLAGSLLLIAAATAVMKTAIPGALAILIIAPALAILAGVLNSLGNMSWEEIAKSMVAIAGAFTILGVAALVLTPLVPTIAALAGSMALFGLACAGIGAGVMAVGIGVTVLAAALAASGGAITIFVSSLIGLIPYFIEQIGVGIIALCEVIAGSAEAICSAAATIIVALVDALVISAPKLVEGALVIVDSLLTALIEYTPKIVSGLFDFLIAVLDELSARLPDLIQAGTNLVMSLFSGIFESLKTIDPAILVNGLIGVGMMAALIAALAAVAALTPAAMIGVLGMGAVIAELSFVLAAVGALAQIPGLEWLIGEGGNLLQTIGTAIGKFIGGIIGGVMGGVTSQLPQIGTDLSTFMTNVKPFIEGAKTIDESVITGVGVLSGAILALTAADFISGIASFLSGGVSFAQLGTDLSTFMTNAKPFLDGVATINPTVAEGAKAIAGAILAITAADILNGLTSWITGGDSMVSFSQQLVPFGESMVAFSNTVAGKIDEGAVTAAANAGKIMAEMASTLPNSGGVLGFFAGENDLGAFTSKIVPFGEAIAEFSKTVAGKVDAEAVTAAANAGKTIAELANNLPNDGGVLGFFTGNNDLKDFGSKLKSFGEAIADFSSEVSGISTGKLSKVLSEVKKLVSMAKDMSGVDFTSLSQFGHSLGELGRTGIEEFISAFTDASKKVKDAGTDMVENLINGVKAKQDATKTTATNTAKKAVSGFETQTDEAESAGKDLGAGLVKGIKAKETAVYNAGYALGQKAVQGEKDGQASNSPSKLTILAGKWLGQGLIVGMEQISSSVYKSGSQLGKTATGTISSTISRISDIVSSDIDAQPTIRPVLDLSDIRSGANSISSMFGYGPSVGVLANVGAISSSMNSRGQNGNDDIVSAINKLRKDVGNMDRASYNINGITYDDGSAVSEAIKVLVREVKVGRRV